jgi:hypothetical protein
LVFQRLLQILRALPQFAEEARILHRDHRLRRKVLQQRDLLIGKWADFLTKGGNGAEHGTILEQWHGNNRARTAELDQSAAHRTDARLRRGIIDLRVGSAAKEALMGAPGLRAI